jgi:hypothetical protein
MKAYPCTPCSWPPWPWLFSREKSLKFSKFRKKKIRNFDPHFINLYLSRKYV